eukprot:3019636-Rhodomonas_salina.5
MSSTEKCVGAHAVRAVATRSRIANALNTRCPPSEAIEGRNPLLSQRLGLLKSLPRRALSLSSRLQSPAVPFRPRASWAGACKRVLRGSCGCAPPPPLLTTPSLPSSPSLLFTPQPTPALLPVKTAFILLSTSPHEGMRQQHWVAGWAKEGTLGPESQDAGVRTSSTDTAPCKLRYQQNP